MKRLLVLLTACVATLAFLSPAGASGPSTNPESGVTSKYVKWVRFIPNEIGTLTGARIVGHYIYMTSWKSFSIYDVSKPLDPRLVSQTFWGQLSGDDPFEFESEDMPTNGKVLIMSETVPRNVLHVFDVTDPAHPKEIATEATPRGSKYSWANHTMSCLYDCAWLYGSAGAIVDLHDPAHPKLVHRLWNKGLPGQSGHDVVEIKPGYTLTATEPIMYLDTHDPVHPKLLALGHAKDDRFIHSVLWPQAGADDFVLVSGETNFRPVCSSSDSSGSLANGAFMTWSAKNWETTHAFTMIDQVRVQIGAFVDGNPPEHVLGCSTHWFDNNPTFDNGGIVAEGTYENGTRFWGITPDGHIMDMGYFQPYWGSTSGAYWRTDRVVYSIDYERGFDVLKYTGPLMSGGSMSR